MSGLPARISATIAVVLFLAGSVLGLAVARGDLHIGAKRPALVLVRKADARVVPRNLAPGDRVERLYTIRNRDRIVLRRLTFDIGERRRRDSGGGTCRRKVGTRRSVCRPAARSRLITSRNGLRVSVDRCGVPWTRLSVGAPRYGCRLGYGVAVAWTRIPASRRLRRVSSLAPGRVAYLRVTVMLPRRATNALEATSAILTPRFSARRSAR